MAEGRFPRIPVNATTMAMAAAAISPGYRRHIQQKIAEEEAAARLVAITAPDGHRAALDEVLERMRKLGMDYLAALESVTDDVAAGRWKP